MNMLIIVLIDFLHGFIDSIKGMAFMRRVLAEEAREPPAEPPRAPRERTVLQMRREQQGIFRAPRSPPRTRPTFLRQLSKSYAMNLSFLFAWQLIARLLETFSPKVGGAIGDVLFVPFFVGSRVVQALWCSDISAACVRALRLPPPNPWDSFQQMISETIVCLTHSVFFLLVGLLMPYFAISMVGRVLMFVHIAVLNSIYCFDYLFDNRNMSFLRRRAIFESHWPFFLGFGTPLALACSLSSSIFFNGVVFSLLYPFFIISSFPANWNRQYAEPIPRVAIFQVSYFFTQCVAKQVRRLTPGNNANNRNGSNGAVRRE